MGEDKMPMEDGDMASAIAEAQQELENEKVHS